MNHYELLYIVPLKMEDDSADQTIDKVTNRIKELGGEFTLNDNLGKRKLAYPIKQIRYGYYVLAEFNMLSENLKIMERELQLASDVIRFQVIRKQVRSAETIARQLALQDKLKTQHAREDMIAETKARTKAPLEPSTKIDDLDKKLDEILENEMVK